MVTLSNRRHALSWGTDVTRGLFNECYEWRPKTWKSLFFRPVPCRAGSWPCSGVLCTKPMGAIIWQQTYNYHFAVGSPHLRVAASSGGNSCSCILVYYGGFLKSAAETMHAYFIFSCITNFNDCKTKAFAEVKQNPWLLIWVFGILTCKSYPVSR